MIRAFQYRRKAKECLRLAKVARNPVIAQLFEQLAEQWLRVVRNSEQIEARLAEYRAKEETSKGASAPLSFGLGGKPSSEVE
jgi:hypothetical protein